MPTLEELAEEAKQRREWLRNQVRKDLDEMQRWTVEGISGADHLVAELQAKLDRLTA